MPDMNLPTNVYTDADGSVYIQARPGSETHFIGGCFEAGDLPNPGFDVEMVQCLDANRSFQVVGATRTAPGKVTSTVTGLTEDSANWLELFSEDFCPFYMHFVQHNCGTRGVWSHWERVYTYLIRAITDDPISGFMSREGGNVTTRAVNWTSFPPRVSSRRLGIGRKTDITETTMATTLWAEPKQCAVDCGDARMLGEVLYLADSTAGGAECHTSTDFGESWGVASVGVIFPVGGYICPTAVAVQLDRDTVRQICFRNDGAAAPLGCAYSDDSGATWTQVAVAAAGTADVIATASQASFALDSEHVWVGNDAGEVYFSDDAGLTWASQGIPVAQAIYSIHFYDANIGALATANGTTATTIDGGTNWIATTAPEAQIVNSIRFTGPSSRHLICATNTGNVWLSTDFCATWTETWAGNGTDINCLDVMAHSNGNTVAFLIDAPATSDNIYQTCDGGLTWQQYTTPGNGGLEHILVLSPTLVFACGEANAGTPGIVKLGQGVS